MTDKLACCIIAAMVEVLTAKDIYLSLLRTPNVLNDPNKEPIPHFDILMPGAGHGTGLFVAELFAMQGYKVHVGTRGVENYNSIRDGFLSVNSEMGLNIVKPSPFIADFTKPGAMKDALERSDIKPDQPVHLVYLAANGFEDLLKLVAHPLIAFRRAFKNGTLTPDLAEQLTNEIKGIVSTDAAFALANCINRDAPIELARMLMKGNHLVPGSRIVTLSSSISDYTDPDYPKYGPCIYRPVGHSKAQGTRGLREIAQSTGAFFIDVVAPEIEGTTVIGLFNSIQPALQSLQPGIPLIIPSVSKARVAHEMVKQITRNDITSSAPRKIYITPEGSSPQMPSDWKIPVIPFL